MAQGRERRELTDTELDTHDGHTTDCLDNVQKVKLLFES